ncbi:flavodoxin family protein [Candidatus Bathyarchaeota archaeon]|nr:flavodoxin family protein [Candidatus Bathyarchaeota archaeon]
MDLLVSEILKGAASKGAESHKFYLNDMNIKPCKSCGVDPHPEHCLLKDDMEQIYDAIEISDSIVLGSPVYFDTVSAQVKLMIDRSNCLMPYVKKSDGTFGFQIRVKRPKRGVFVVVSGKKQGLDIILTTVKGFFLWTNTELVETISYLHDDNELGSVKKDLLKMKHAFDIGVSISKQMSIQFKDA